MIRLASAALLLCVAATAGAQDFPKRKSGLWEIKTNATTPGPAGANPGPVVMQMCIDEKTDNAAQQQAGGFSKQNCSKQDVKRSGTTMTVDTVCNLGQTTATTHSVFTGSFDSAYKVDTKSTYDPPLGGMREGGAVIEAKWLGACKADQRPGDMILGNGMKMNMNDFNGAPPPRR